MAKKSNNNKDIRHGDRTRQNKDEFGAKASHFGSNKQAGEGDFAHKGKRRQGRQ